MASGRKHSNPLLRAAIALALSQGALVQTAQAQSTEPKKDEVTAVDSLVVTARRREELIQDVPGAVTAFSGAAIEKAALPNLTAIGDLVPNTTLKASRATNTTLTAFIRGIGQQDPVAGYEPGVGIYLDDVYLARPQGSLTDIYDLARIEILRGPQGTLYGRNTIGGAVKYVTRRLLPDTELNIKTVFGSYSQFDVIAKGNLALTDTVRLGGTIASFNRDGYGTNVDNGKDNYNKDVLAGRVSAEFTPNKDLFIRFAADRTQDDSLPKLGHRLTLGPAPTNEPVLDGHYDTRGNLYTVLGKPQEVTTQGESLLIDWTISPTLSFKSITAHRKGESTSPIDFDSLNRVLFEAPALYHDSQTSQEFQFTYTGNRWQGVAGAYFMRANAFNEFDALLLASVPQGVSIYTLDDMDTRTWAAFADVSYKVSDTFDITLGGRYTSDERKARIYSRVYLGMAGSPTLGNPNAIGGAPNTDMSKDDLQRTDTKFTPKIGFGWKFNPDHNLYATYSEGFKAGFFDPRMNLAATGGPNTIASLQKRQGVEPEELASYEMGLKSAFNGGRIQTNLAAFYADYTNVQVPGGIPTYDANGNVNGFAGNPTNAGKAKIKGLEFEALARVTDAFTMSGMLAFINAEYKEWIVPNGLTGSAAALVDIAPFAEFQNTPERAASITGTYTWPLAIFGRSGALDFTNTLSYKSTVYQGEVVRPTGVPSYDVLISGLNMLTQSGYTLWDAGLVWTSRDRKIQAGLVGRNLTDKRYKTAGYVYTPYYNTVTAFYGDPRTVRATLSLTF